MQTAKPPLPTPEYMENSKWIHDHIDELAATYANMWVAAFQGRIIAAAPGLTAVTESAERQAPRYDIAYHFVDDGSMIY